MRTIIVASSVLLAALIASTGYASPVKKVDPVVDAFQKRACTRNARDPLNRIEFLMKRYFTNDISVDSLPKNFEILEQESAAFLKEIQTVADKYKAANITSQDDYNKNLSAFEKEISLVQEDKLKKLNFKQRLFATSLISVEADIRDVNTQAESILAMNCPDLTKKNLETIKSLSLKMATKTAKYRLLTEQKMSAMGEVSETVRVGIRANFVYNFSRNVATKAEELIATIDAGFAMFKITDDIALWHQRSFVNQGPGRGLWRRYFLYDLALKQLQKDIDEGNAFYQKIIDLKLPKYQADIANAQLLSNLASLENAKKDIEKRGFSDRLAMHHRVVKASETSPKKWTSSFCDNEFSKYKATLQNIETKNDLGTFVSSESTLKDFLSLCFYKE